MRVLYVDPVGGLAGDMFLAGLVELGASLDAIDATLRTLPITGWRFETRSVMRGPFAARHLAVLPDPGGAPPNVGLPDDRQHTHTHDHGHGHEHGHGHDHHRDTGAHVPWADQPDRSWSTIRSLIGDADIPTRARARALAAFGLLAEAEARVHGCEVDTVTFHEVGAVDSVVDLLGVCLALEHLGVDKLVCGALPVASGTTGSQHGPIPLPAPATLALLEGWPVRPGLPGFEQVTPTGAALVAALAEPGDYPAMRIARVGVGAGTRDTRDIPNVVRLVLGDRTEPSSPTRVAVIRAQMDDLSGEHLPALIDALLHAGALDVIAVPALMKKGRQGVLVEVLCTPPLAREVGTTLLRHGSSFGYRHQTMERVVLDRWHERVDTMFGPVRVKVGALNGEILHAAPEHEDVRLRAAEAGAPIPTVHSETVAAWHGRRNRAGEE